MTPNVTLPPPPVWQTTVSEWNAVPNPFTNFGDDNDYDRDGDGMPTTSSPFDHHDHTHHD